MFINSTYDQTKHTPGFGQAARPVVDGRRAPVTCVTCGCRLGADTARGLWFHFDGQRPGIDARGCTAPCVGLPHRHA